jgi:hypothetical protein
MLGAAAQQCSLPFQGPHEATKVANPQSADKASFKLLPICNAGYGFVSFTDPIEGAKALREMDGKYVGNRPCKLRKSTWDERIDQQQVNKKKRKGNPDGKPILNHKKHVGLLQR